MAQVVVGESVNEGGSTVALVSTRKVVVFKTLVSISYDHLLLVKALLYSTV